MKYKSLYGIAVVVVLFDIFLVSAVVNTTYQQNKRIEKLEIQSTARQKAIELLKANIVKLYADKNNVGG